MGTAAKRLAGKTRRAKHFSLDPTCATCGGVRALTATTDAPVCYECRRVAQGASRYEQHHPLGRAVDPRTVPMPGNAHRIVDALKAAWPPEVRQNVDRRPLLLLAGFLLFLRDLGLLLHAMCQEFADWLLAAHRQLQAAHPSQSWEVALGLRPL